MPTLLAFSLRASCSQALGGLTALLRGLSCSSSYDFIDLGLGCDACNQVADLLDEGGVVVAMLGGHFDMKVSECGGELIDERLFLLHSARESSHMVG